MVRLANYPIAFIAQSLIQSRFNIFKILTSSYNDYYLVGCNLRSLYAKNTEGLQQAVTVQILVRNWLRLHMS